MFALSGIFKSIDYRLVDLESGKSTAEIIYHEACVNVITRDNSLLLLKAVGGIWTTEGLPSWVPDFSQPFAPYTHGIQVYAASGNSTQSEIPS